MAGGSGLSTRSGAQPLEEGIVKSWSTGQDPELDRRGIRADQWEGDLIQEIARTGHKCQQLGRVSC